MGKIFVTTHEEIQKAFVEGEEAVLALFDKFAAQLIALAGQLDFKAALYFQRGFFYVQQIVILQTS
jgi:hypothetical protein